MSHLQQELTLYFSGRKRLGESYFFTPMLPLHPKPLSAHGFSGVSYLGTLAYQKASPDYWHGRLLRGLAGTAVIGGYFLNSLVAGAEAVTSLAAGIFLTTSYCVSCSSSDWVLKQAIKAWSYCLHSVGVIAVQVGMIFMKLFGGYHSLNCLTSHALHLLSAAVVLYCSNEFSEYEICYGEQEGPEVIGLVSFTRTFIQSGPLLELLRALDSDFGEGATPDQFQLQLQAQSLIRFFERYPIHKTLWDGLGDLSWDCFLEEDFRGRVRAFAADFVYFSYHPNAHEEVLPVKVLSSNNEQENVYLEALEGYTKAAVKAIYRDDVLAGYLSENGVADEGKEALRDFDPQMYVLLARFTQLLELEAKEVLCPQKFCNSRMQDHNGRHTELLAARELLGKLVEDSNLKDLKPILIRKLLSATAFSPDLPDIVKKDFENLVKKIDNLAGSLHQGTLMNLQTQEERTAKTSSQNHFHKAYREAVE